MGENEEIFYLNDDIYLFRSCILEDNLCNWSYGICSHIKLPQLDNNGDFCIKKKSYRNCQCDRGYEMKKVNICNIKIFKYILFFFLSRIMMKVFHVL